MENRKRSINWDEGERTLLREIITPKIGLIHNKNTDSNTNKEKKQAWEEVTKCFNTINTRERSIVEIKAQWKCMKMKAKASESLYRRQSRQTGGGPRPTSPSQEDQKMMSLIPSEFERDYNEFDCDGVLDSVEFTIIETGDSTQNSSNVDHPTSRQETIVKHSLFNSPNAEASIQIIDAEVGPVNSSSAEASVRKRTNADESPLIFQNPFKGNKTPKHKRRNPGESSADCKEQTADLIRGEIGSLTAEAIRQKMLFRQLEHDQLMKEREELLEMKRAEHDQLMKEREELLEIKRAEHAQLLRHKEELHQLEIEALKKKHC